MRRLATALVTGILVLGLAGLAACGQEEELEVVEGEPVELGELHYNVQITRFLNPYDPEDASYVGELEPPGADEQYLAVFVKVENAGGEDIAIADELTVIDTRENEFGPVESESPFELELGTTIEAHGVLPAPGTPAASGPIKGAMVLFLVDAAVSENRPLELEIPGPEGETGTVELDI